MSESMRVQVGGTFEIPLEGNATIGFQWELQAPAATADLVDLLDATYDADKTRVGAPGVHRFRFRALAPGLVNLVFQYRRP